MNIDEFVQMHPELFDDPNIDAIIIDFKSVGIIDAYDIGIFSKINQDQIDMEADYIRLRDNLELELEINHFGLPKGIVPVEEKQCSTQK